MTRAPYLWATLLLASCAAGSDPPPDDPIDAPRPDAAVVDAAPVDAPPIDALSIDARPIDAPPPIDAAPPTDGTPGPLALTLVGSTLTATAGHSSNTGSEVANDLCAPGAVLTGLRGRLRGTDLYNGPVWGACTPLVLVSPPPSITTGAPVAELPTHGNALAGDTEWTRDCPPGQVVVAISGRAGAIIDQLVVSCAPLVVAATPPHLVSTGAATALPLAGNTGGGAAFTPPTCPAGQIAHGLTTYFEGDPGFGLPRIYLDGVALACTTPTVQ